jgi:polygalacturonase
MTLDVEAGATVLFPVAPLPFVKGRYLGVEALVPMPLVGGQDVENVAITGRGTLITGDFVQWATAYGPAPKIADKSENANGPHWDHLLKLIEAGQTVSEGDYRAAAQELRPSFICFTRAKNVLVEGVRVVGGPAFVVHLLYSENATVRNVTIDAYPGAHANGIVVDSSQFVRISNDSVDTGDDGIVIKAGKDADGLRVNRPSEDVAITNCTVHHAHGAVVIGSETSGGIRNIVASNIVADGTEAGIRIKSRRGRGGAVEDARFDNWTMRGVGKAIEITSYYVMGGETRTTQEPVSARTPAFRNIAISNVAIQGAKQVADIEGLPEMPIDGLRLTNMIGSGETGLLARFTDALELHHVLADSAHGPAFTIESASNLELDDVATRAPHEDSPVAALDRCAGAIVRNSRATAETRTFLSTSPGELKSMRLVGNHLENTQVRTAERMSP